MSGDGGASGIGRLSTDPREPVHGVFTAVRGGIGDLKSIPLAAGTPSLLASDVYADSLATDGVAVYWTDENLAAVMKLNLASGAPIALAPYNGVGTWYGRLRRRHT